MKLNESTSERETTYPVFQVDHLLDSRDRHCRILGFNFVMQIHPTSYLDVHIS